MRIAILGCALAVLMLATASFAQDYIGSGSIGSTDSTSSDCSDEPFSFLPVQCWEGESVVFLPVFVSVRGYGYQSFTGGSGSFGSPTYDEAVGKVGVIEEVIDEDYKWLVRVRMEDGRVYEGEAFDTLGGGTDASLDGVAFTRDIDAARAVYLGQPLWFKKTTLSTYDEEQDNLGSIELPRFSQVEVISIVAGWYSHTPVRFVLEDAEGRVGFVDLNLSGTNVSQTLREFGHFEDTFFTADPRLLYQWADDVWSAITERQVFVGMTREQAMFSWGEPSDINRTLSSGSNREQWAYGSGSYLYFEGGVLTSIQN